MEVMASSWPLRETIALNVTVTFNMPSQGVAVKKFPGLRHQPWAELEIKVKEMGPTLEKQEVEKMQEVL